MIALLESIVDILSNCYVLFAVILFSLCCKLFVLIGTIRFTFRTSIHRVLLIFLILYLYGAILGDLAYTIFLIFLRIIPYENPGLGVNFAMRIGWVFFITQYQSIVCFFDYLTTKKIQINFIYICHIIFNIVISSQFFYLAFFHYYTPPDSAITLGYEISLIKITLLYLPFLLLPTFYKIYKHMRAKSTPLILYHQIRYFANFYIPFLILETQANHIGIWIPLQQNYLFSFFMVTTVLSTCTMFFVSQRILGLRFLNLRKDVESKEKFNFLAQFKDILEQLSYATALKELAHLSQTFFKAAFDLPIGRTRLYIRRAEPDSDDNSFYDIAHISTRVEHFITKKENKNALKVLAESKIYIKDEIEFTNFYEEDSVNSEILYFLEDINADIFLPIFERNMITAYIIVERDARPNRLYTNKERDEMLVFTSYLSNIINILKYSNIEAMHQRHKQLTEELYQKHQEINQYKESIRSFMRNNRERKIGIVFYKTRRFTPANEAAQELIGMDLNSNEGHPLTQACKGVARKVQIYKTAQTDFARDNNGQRIIIAGIPSLEEHATILLLYYPEISDIMKAQFDQLKDPSQWDYLLYLETTQSGQLINQLIPGSGEKLLSFKIDLLSTALSKKATLLDMPEDDLLPTVEILHQVSLRKTLHTVKLSNPEQHDEVAKILFGMNPLIEKDAPQALLEKLDSTGTLFIQNIEYLSLDTQKYLAEYLSYGFFHKFKSDHKIFSTVRIICSTTKDLLILVGEGAFSKDLYNELHKTSLTMPSMHTLTEEEVEVLAQGFADQVITSDTYKNLLSLTDKDKLRLQSDRPLSLRDFKEKVHQLMVTKSTKHNIKEETDFDPAYNVTDPEIAQAVRMGKKALKDPHMMTILWNKFKNQNKIATLLGVNRSSVNRRCQEYNLK